MGDFEQYSNTGGNLYETLGIAFNSSGTLFCTDSSNNTIVQINSLGNVNSFAPASDSTAALAYPSGLAFDSNGILYCSCGDSDTVVQIDSFGKVTPFAPSLDSTAQLDRPYGLAFDSNGTLYCSNFSGDSVVKIDSSGKVTPFASNSELLFIPSGLAFDSNGTLYCCSSGRNYLVYFDSLGNVYNFAPSAGSTTSLREPTDLVFNKSTGGFFCSNLDIFPIFPTKPSYTVEISSSGFTTPYINDIGTGTYEPGALAIYDYYLYFVNGGAVNDPDVIYKTVSPICFNHDTKILCLNHLLEEEYIPIQDLKKGDFVKTYLHGFRRIDLTHKGVLFNNPNKWNRCMYKMEKTEENELLEDLIVTGGHAIMVDSISEVQQERYNNIGLPNFAKENKIDDKYLLLSSVSEKFIPLTDNKSYTIYHFCLENDGDNNARYGVWANGILTETPSKSYLVEQR